MKLYRKIYIEDFDANTYEGSIGRVICFPSFTSCFEDIKAFEMEYNVLFIIKSNNSKSVVNIENLSEFSNEKEYLFLPFSFFKIINVEKKKKFHKIYLLAMNSEKPIEEMFLNFFEKCTDSLDPEGLDILQLNNDKILFNSDYYL